MFFEYYYMGSVVVGGFGIVGVVGVLVVLFVGGLVDKFGVGKVI